MAGVRFAPPEAAIAARPNFKSTNVQRRPSAQHPLLGSEVFSFFPDKTDELLDHCRLVAPALGLHTLMGERRQDQTKNMIESISTGIIAPVELIVRKSY